MDQMYNASSARHAIPSPNGTLFAHVQQAQLIVRSVSSDEVVCSFSIGSDFAARCNFVCWNQLKDATHIAPRTSGASDATRILVADDDTVKVFDVTDSSWQAVISGAAGSLGKVAKVFFGAQPYEIVVFSDFGVRATIWSLLTDRGVEIKDPKYLVSCLSIRPKTGHLAILTRASAQDVLMLISPKTHEVVRSIEIGTSDAQEVRWSRDGKWFAVRDAASAGHYVQIYTADGYPFRLYRGREDNEKIGLGIQMMTWNCAHNLLLGDCNGDITILRKDTFSAMAHLSHDFPIHIQDAPVWEEQIDASRERTYALAAQPATPPPAANFSKAVVIKHGISMMQSNATDTLLATRCDEIPTTAWIWSLHTGKPVAVLIHHSPIKHMAWNLDSTDTLLIHCAIAEPTVHLWSLTWPQPRAVRLPLERPDGRLEARWLNCQSEKQMIVILSSQTHFQVSRVSETGDYISDLNASGFATKSNGTGPEEMFDEGNSVDLSPVKHDGNNEFAEELRGFGSDSFMSENGIDDTFHHRRQIKATG